VEVFGKLGYFRLADVVGTKTIEKHLQNLREKQRHTGETGVDLEGWAEHVLSFKRRVFHAL